MMKNKFSQILRFFSLLSVTLILLAVVSCRDDKRLVEPKYETAHLLVKDNEFYFGVVKDADGMLERDFIVMNDGKESLVISNVHNHCHCTEVDYPKTPIRPGHGVRVKVRLDVRSLQQGTFSRTIDFYPNGGATPARVTVSGQKI